MKRGPPKKSIADGLFFLTLFGRCLFVHLSPLHCLTMPTTKLKLTDAEWKERRRQQKAASRARKKAAAEAKAREEAAALERALEAKRASARARQAKYRAKKKAAKEATEATKSQQLLEAKRFIEEKQAKIALLSSQEKADLFQTCRIIQQQQHELQLSNFFNGEAVDDYLVEQYAEMIQYADSVLGTQREQESDSSFSCRLESYRRKSFLKK